MPVVWGGLSAGRRPNWAALVGWAAGRFAHQVTQSSAADALGGRGGEGQYVSDPLTNDNDGIREEPESVPRQMVQARPLMFEFSELSFTLLSSKRYIIFFNKKI